ncbi:hypothetical protein C5167_030625 [Papaver somniferum]|nr:hypothetical protein C5167_030625 [Papaver somniferum]
MQQIYGPSCALFRTTGGILFDPHSGYNFDKRMSGDNMNVFTALPEGKVPSKDFGKEIGNHSPL